MFVCVSVASGLFDSAINYAWNAATIALREKVRQFGLNVIPHVTGKSFDEDALLDLKDAELLQLCLKLNLITEDGHFFLDQCRDIRNNFSAAHPTMGSLDEHEFLSFLSRCAKHALANEQNPRGVDIQAFLNAIKSAKFTQTQLETWNSRISETFDAQRDAIIGILHGIYCDPSSGEEARVNAISISYAFKEIFTPRTKSEIIDRHQDYRAKGDDARHRASQQFFENLGILGLLGDSEIHSLITTACTNLLSVHNSFNNFYNEPPFAERLAGIASQNRVPETAQNDFVEAVIICATGNPYGVSNAALPWYYNMIRSFSPAEVKIMLDLPSTASPVGRRIQSYTQCQKRFANLTSFIDSSSVLLSARKAFDDWQKRIS